LSSSKSLVDFLIFKHIMRSRDSITVGRTNPRDDLSAVLEGETEKHQEIIEFTTGKLREWEEEDQAR
jgi:hypothetical protein